MWQDDPDSEPVPVLASFREGAENLRERLEKAGATPRTVAGTVVTLSAPPDALLAIAAFPDLVRLQAPRTLRPNR